MPAISSTLVLIVGDSVDPHLTALFESNGLRCQTLAPHGTSPDRIAEAQLILGLATPQTLTTLSNLCRRWRIELSEHYIPILWLARDLTDRQMAEGLDAGADAVLVDSVADRFLLSQVRSLLRVQHLQSHLAARAGELSQVNQRLQQTYQQMESDFELLRRIQRGFLPQTLPAVGRVRIAVNYRPRSRIGGDFYDAFRLDENHIGFFVADAMGRGLPASCLLSIFVKNSIRAKEIDGRGYHLVPPEEILQHLNRELLALNMNDPPFVSILWGQININTGLLSFARAGHPHPLHVPRDGSVSYWYASGTLLGVFESEFPSLSHQLEVGDKVLIVSDGAHSAEVGTAGTSGDILSQVADRHRQLPLTQFLDAVTQEILVSSRQQEDVTLMALEFGEEG